MAAAAEAGGRQRRGSKSSRSKKRGGSSSPSSSSSSVLWPPPLLLFPEGTTTNGRYLLRFKTGAFLAGESVFFFFFFSILVSLERDGRCFKKAEGKKNSTCYLSLSLCKLSFFFFLLGLKTRSPRRPRAAVLRSLAGVQVQPFVGEFAFLPLLFLLLLLFPPFFSRPPK